MNAPNASHVTLVNPIGAVDTGRVTLAPRLHSLNARVISLINTGKPSIEHFLEEIEVLLRKDYPDIDIRHARKDFTSAKPIAHELDSDVEAAISAWGD